LLPVVNSNVKTADEKNCCDDGDDGSNHCVCFVLVKE
jgi:hypothetical protein